MNSFLADANVWLALSHDRHVHHTAASEWFNSNESPIYFCRITQLALLRLLTNPRVMTTAVKTHLEAWQIYDGLRSQARVGFAAEPWNIEPSLRELTKTRKYSPNTWTDAYLGAMARTLDLRIVTFDADFRTMRGVDAVVLTQAR
jgi:toxin-antitoxin system PIN domain toxin